ncbi:MAG: hypothetical protein CSA35_05180 [Dethiosulfovibrio peptidovorans]|nr:MAG: hypothetical protein CSA35_05180 [Dethiosulfovibrio peptidovorans]
MAKKRPSLRKYLTEGDDVRGMAVPVSSPPEVTLREDLVRELLSVCPPQGLRLQEWGIVVAISLLRWRGEKTSLKNLSEFFSDDPTEALNSLVDDLRFLEVLQVRGENVTVGAPSSWNLSRRAAETKNERERKLSPFQEPPPSQAENDMSLVDLLSNDDRMLWSDLLKTADVFPLSIDKLRREFDAIEVTTTQLYGMRRDGESLRPIIRASQIRHPLVMALFWSEDGTVRAYVARDKETT